MFIDEGYPVYLVDQTSVSRGTQEDLAGYPLRIGSTSNISEVGFTNPQAADAYPQSQLHTQWPGSGVRGDAIFDAFESGFIPHFQQYSPRNFHVSCRLRIAESDWPFVSCLSFHRRSPSDCHIRRMSIIGCRKCEP
jgi:hypothetical protein